MFSYLYVEKCSCHFEPFNIFRCTRILDIPAWADIQKNIKYLFKNKKLNLDWSMGEDKLFDEYNYLVYIIQKSQKSSVMYLIQTLEKKVFL